MDIHQLTKVEDDVYFSKEFIQVIEDHLTYLRTVAPISTVAISLHLSTKHEGDFYGVLSDLGIEKKYHFTILRINGFENTTDYKGDIDYFIMPDLSEIEEIKMLHMTIQS